MDISCDKRDGTARPSKKRPISSRTIHIEHTVQVAVLVAALRASIGKFDTPYALHRYLIDRTICTAFSSEEEDWLRDTERWEGHYNAFKNGEELENIYPFRRYLPLIGEARKHRSDFRIFNVATRKEINLEKFRLADHVSSLRQASEMVAPNGPYLYDLDMLNGLPQ